jgi:thiamine phosphate synthase YjbQ (UPF0047 family)
MGLALDDLAPQRRDFRHAEGNSPAHVKSSLVLVLGSWQGIYLAEFDGPRTRNVLVKVVTA